MHTLIDLPFSRLSRDPSDRSRTLYTAVAGLNEVLEVSGRLLTPALRFRWVPHPGQEAKLVRVDQSKGSNALWHPVDIVRLRPGGLCAVPNGVSGPYDLLIGIRFKTWFDMKVALVGFIRRIPAAGS